MPSPPPSVLRRPPTRAPGATGTPISTPQTPPGGIDPGIPAWIAQWQQTHDPHEGIGPLAEAIARQFPGISRYMYGETPSGNELNIGGERYKVIGGENSSSPYWYVPGTDDSPGGSTTVGRRPNPDGSPSEGTAVPRASLTHGVPNPYPAAYDAARRQRQTAGAGGRRATILGGFRPGTPLTRPATMLSGSRA